MDLVLSWLHLLSVNAELTKITAANVNNLFIAYVILSVILKRSVFLLAFFISCGLMMCSLFDNLSEWHIYAFTSIMYSYVFTQQMPKLSKICCAIITFISLALSVDALFYGMNGIYETRSTFLYQNIEIISSSAHCFFIYSFINVSKIRTGSRSFIGAFSALSRSC